jgi:hypothetical protein
MFPTRFARFAVVALVTSGLSTGCLPPPAAAEPSTAAACAFDDVAFDPHGGVVVQGASANGETCVRLARASLADVRRGTEWRAQSLSVVVDGRAIEWDEGALSYENSHHNCKDVVRSVDDEVTLTIDGASDDPNVCFDGAPEEWRLLLSVNGAQAEELAPHVPPHVPR